MTSIFKTAAVMVFLATMANAETVNGLRDASEFDTIENEGERSVALFDEMMEVISHPRCMNCHPVDNTPRQGMDMQLHEPPVVRGAADFGAPGMRCTTCHAGENVEFTTTEGSIPGHEPWALAPIEMGWIGKSKGEICAQLKDPERNGGKSLDELQVHNAEDGLVGWGWHPGEGREPVPGTQEVFGELTRAWIETGAACPQG